MIANLINESSMEGCRLKRPLAVVVLPSQPSEVHEKKLLEYFYTRSFNISDA